MISVKALPENSPQELLKDHIKKFSVKWKGMSDNEKAAVSDVNIPLLESFCEVMRTAIYNVPIAAFQDVRQTLDRVEKEVC